MSDVVVNLEITRIPREDLKTAIENIMARVPMPKTAEGVMAQFQNPAFCLGIMSGLLMLADHKDVADVLTDKQSNHRVLALLANVAKNNGLQVGSH